MFNFIETSFFLSLGITFILILLLVYHFNQRISSVEQKSETMFEIMNNLVKELNSVKHNVMASQFTMFPPSFREGGLSFNISPERVPLQNVELMRDEYDDQDDMDEDVDDMDVEEEEDQDDIDADIYNEDEDEDDMDAEEGLEYNPEFEKTTHFVNPIDITEIDKMYISDDENDEDESEIKIINIPELGGNFTINNDKISEDVLDIQEMTEDVVTSLGSIEPTEFVVSKIDETETETEPDTEGEHPVSHEDAHSVILNSPKDAYKKMTLSALKTLVISKGLSSDPSKMKKHDLIQLLEN